MNNQVTVIFVVLVALAMGCARSAALHQQMNSQSSFIGSAPSGENRMPKILVEAHPRVGFAPLRVTLKAVLQNVHGNDPIFGCLWESWKFGDGAVSSEKSNCDAAPSVETEFFVEHIYRDEGVYEVRFVLGDNQVPSRPVSIRVLGR